MKTFLILAAALTATSVFADTADKRPPPNPGNGNCVVCAESDIYIGGNTLQVTAASSSFVKNSAEDDATAVQSISSNTQGVRVEGTLTQITALSNSGVVNKAEDDATARQNLASNIGAVGIKGGADLTQVVAASNSFFVNKAMNSARAVQNVSSNNACEACD